MISQIRHVPDFNFLNPTGARFAQIYIWHREGEGKKTDLGKKLVNIGPDAATRPDLNANIADELISHR